LFGAGDRIRTGDVQLGRLTLYQLSYTRVGVFPEIFGAARERDPEKRDTSVEGGGFEPP
jgi:hypothetical protein